MHATWVSFLEQSPFATSDIISHMTISFVIYAVLRYGHSKFSKMAASRHLGFGATGSRSVRSALRYATTRKIRTFCKKCISNDGGV